MQGNIVLFITEAVGQWTAIWQISMSCRFNFLALHVWELPLNSALILLVGHQDEPVKIE